MKYPCVECIVDAICNEACDKVMLYFKHIDQTKKKYIPKDFVLTKLRYTRIIRCLDWSQYSFELYVNLSNHLRRYIF